MLVLSIQETMWRPMIIHTQKIKIFKIFIKWKKEKKKLKNLENLNNLKTKKQTPERGVAQHCRPFSVFNFDEFFGLGIKCVGFWQQNHIDKIWELDTNLSPTKNPHLIIWFWDHHRVDLVESFRLVVERDPET